MLYNKGNTLKSCQKLLVGFQNNSVHNYGPRDTLYQNCLIILTVSFSYVNIGETLKMFI